MRLQIYRPGGLLALLLLLTQNATAFTLVYMGNLNGELEPCGCTLEGDFGGIKRQVSMLDRLRQAEPELMFLSPGGLLIADIPSDRIRSDFILRGMRILKPDIVGVQARDLAFGVDFLRHRQLPFVLSLTLKDAPFAWKKILQRQQQRFTFFQWSKLNAALMPAQPMPTQAAALQRLEKELRTEKNTGHVTIVTAAQHPARAKAILPLKHIDILIIPARRDEFIEPEKIGNTLLLQPGARGMRLGKLDFELAGDGRAKHIARWRHDVIPLLPSVPDSPRTRAWYEEYNAALKADYEKQVARRKQQEQGGSPYAGAEACRGCHARAFDIWQASQHARACGELESVGKVFDPSCSGCHSVGFGQPGGFLDAELTPQLSGVQCESCHGAARAHAESAGKKPVTGKERSREAICRQCHTGSHSPVFDLQKYWPKVAHGQKNE